MLVNWVKLGRKQCVSDHRDVSNIMGLTDTKNRADNAYINGLDFDSSGNLVTTW